MTYWSQSWQDEFVANLLNFKKNGYYLDIGSGSPTAQSNSYFFESELNWNGICVEKGIGYDSLYKETRKCYFINSDATKVDYKSIMDEKKYPKRIDYLSIDIDEGSAQALNALPLNSYRFNIITIEHDSYRFGDILKNQEREALRYYGYHLLFPDVLVPIGCGMGPLLAYEDWWVESSVFDMIKLNKISAEKQYPDEIVATIKNKKEIWVK